MRVLQSLRVPSRPAARLAVPALLTGLLCVGGAPPRATAETEAPPALIVEAPEAREERLFHLLCRYLKLTRTQVLHLTPFARQTSRGRELLERECAERQRVADALAAAQPEASARLRQDIEQRREAVLADLAATGTRALIRNLTREQIVLVWRLTQLNPPKSAQFDPAILELVSGLSPGESASKRLPELDLGFRMSPTERSTLSGVPAELDRAISGVGGGLAVSRVMRNMRVGESSNGRPFPQLAAETSDPNDLLPALQPLAARVFSSERWLPVLEAILRSGESPAGKRLATPGSLRLLRDFRMERGFRDLTGRGSALEPLGGAVEYGLYLFDPGQGLRVPDTGVTDHYAIQLNLVYHGATSYQKILDFKNGTSDNGLYFYQGHLTFYTLANGGAPVPEQEHRLRVERNRTTKIVRVLLDLRPIFAFVDVDDDAVFEQGAGALFLDDTSTKTEQGAGALRSVNVWGPAPAR